MDAAELKIPFIAKEMRVRRYTPRMVMYTMLLWKRYLIKEICVGLQAKYTKKSPGGNIAVLDIIVDSVNDDGLTLDVTVLPEGACEKVSRGSISIASLKESRAVALRTANQSSPLHSSGLNHTLVSQASSNKALAPQSPLSASITSVSSSPTVSNNLEETEPMDPKFSASVAPNHTQYRHNKHGASPSETFPPKGTPSHSCCNVSSAGCNAHTQPRSYAYLPHHEDVCVCDGAQPTNGQTAPRMPKLPPMGSATSVSDEALGEMLMSWYHAGYTTGRMQSAREYEGVGGCDCRPY
eukprot:CFRG7508T1